MATWTTPTNFAAEEIVTSTKLNEQVIQDLLYLYDRSEIAYQAVTAPLGSPFTATETDLVSVTFTAVAGIIYEITGHARISSDGSGHVALRFQDGGSETNRQNLALDSSFSPGMTFSARRTYGGGSVTFRLTGQRVSGSANLNIDASAAAPAYLLVKAIGAV